MRQREKNEDLQKMLIEQEQISKKKDEQICRLKEQVKLKELEVEKMEKWGKRKEFEDIRHECE